MTTTQLDRLTGQLTGLWEDFDTLMEPLDAEGWRIRHGADWTLADVPFHIGYFDGHMAQYIEQGADLNEADRLPLASLADMDRWNAVQTALRPAGQTPSQAIAGMRLVRGRILAAVAGMTDADLDRPAWNHLLPLRGWRTVRTALETCILHTWNEFVQFRFYLGTDAPEPDPELTYFCTGGFLAYFQAFMDPEAAAEHRLVTVYEFPEVGVWTVRIAAGAAAVSEGRAEDADLAFTQSYVTFMKTFNGMHDPAEAIGTGEIRVDGVEHLPVFAALYPPPDPAKTVPAFP